MLFQLIVSFSQGSTISLEAWNFLFLPIPGNIQLPFCHGERNETTHVYIASENYPAEMPGTDQDCSCDITAIDGSLMVVNITAEKVHLYGNGNDPCRERLSIDAGRSYQICPEDRIDDSNHQYISNGQGLHPHLRVNKSSILVLHLKTNSTATSEEQTGKVLLAVSSYGTCLFIIVYHLDYYVTHNNQAM